MSAEERCRCGGPLQPAQDAVVPVLRCAACGRELPATAITAAAVA